MFEKVFLILLLVHAYQAQRKYVPPAPLVEPLHPIGIRMSIPDEPGIQLVAYHVKINDEMVGLEAGTIARDIPSAKRGRWTYQDKTTQLQRGDTIYYWIHVIYRGLGYNLVDQEYVVSDFYEYNGNREQSSTAFVTPKYQTQPYVPPTPVIQPLSPIGFRISIPHQAGIRFVAYHLKINEEFSGLEAGTIFKDVTFTKDGHWIYHDKSIKLKNGDIIYYWVHVIYNYRNYNLVNKKYIVEDFYDNNGNKIRSCNEPCSYILLNPNRPINNCQTQCYVPPAPLIEPLIPGGIRMSIPDEAGISLVGFHAKINNEFVGLEAGTIARDIAVAKNRRWTYRDTTTKLNRGDVIYYWIYVVYDHLGYHLVEQNYTVTDFLISNDENTKISNNLTGATQSDGDKKTLQPSFATIGQA